eukprot:763259-Hanusia_phi.AAC.1
MIHGDHTRLPSDSGPRRGQSDTQSHGPSDSVRPGSGPRAARRRGGIASARIGWRGRCQARPGPTTDRTRRGSSDDSWSRLPAAGGGPAAPRRRGQHLLS